MAGATDISSILSQAGRIEKINQNSFVQSEVARQILTEDEAKQRLRKNREVNESDKPHDIATKDREHRRQKEQKKSHQEGLEKDNPEGGTQETGKRHIIDVVV